MNINYNNIQQFVTNEFETILELERWLKKVNKDVLYIKYVEERNNDLSVESYREITKKELQRYFIEQYVEGMENEEEYEEKINKYRNKTIYFKNIRGV